MKRKILIIEDDNILQEAIKNALELEGFDVIKASDGAEGLKKIKNSKIDLIMLDLVLPKKDGYHLLYEINKNKKTKKIPVIILTAIDSESSDLECKTYGANDYLVKSEYTISEIISKIKKYIK